GVGNNGKGVAGVSWNVSIMAVKFLDDYGSGWTSDAIDAISYATMMGADIMSNSWGGGEYSSALEEAIRAADDAGILFVAAAGNDYENIDNYPFYPAGYDVPNIISVAATDHNDIIADFSNYGNLTVDLGAPGVDVLSSVPGNVYDLYSGTSMATPHVSGAAALLKAFNPQLTHHEIKNILMNSVDPLPSLNGKTVSGGRLNVYKAITIAPRPVNLIKNPGFENDKANWTFYTNTTGNYFTIVSPGFEGTKAARLAMGSKGSNIQLYQTGVTLEPKGIYRLSF
ncbi:MAG: S8 family serine peptidase, partial [Candidatus Methanoperedens sp.]|nr:S8 family serine peptidase [Candidatus Methanoperedens sp.]